MIAGHENTAALQSDCSAVSCHSARDMLMQHAAYVQLCLKDSICASTLEQRDGCFVKEMQKQHGNIIVCLWQAHAHTQIAQWCQLQ